MVHLACTHCGNQFEMETLTGAVCPSCGWSSSIVKASDLQADSGLNISPKIKAEPPHWVLGFFFFCLKVLLLIAAIAGMIFAVWFFAQTRGQIKKDHGNSSDISAQQISLPGEDSQPSGELTENEKKRLAEALDVMDEPVLNDQSLKLLQRSVDLQSTLVEKLPSASWTAADFKEFIKLQEEKFKISLPRGYKKDMEELFEKTYAAAYDLFLKGQLLASRDAYVASLAFPVYGNDLRKHRAVVLTMMRGFLNDTIAKIGALNFALARQKSRSAADQVGESYGQLQQFIRNNKWSNALDELRKIEALLPANTQVKIVSQAPPYGAAFAQVDSDIQPALSQLLQIPAWPFDVNELKGDLSVKKMILLPLADPERGPSIQKYKRAMELIHSQSWKEAAELLMQIKSPEDLAQDADDKLRLIERLLFVEKGVSQ